MQINQHNYEEFFLMYVDNELSAQEKEMVERFAQQNPELAGELDLLKQTVLGSDEDTAFAGKEKLLRSAALTEEELLTYLDGEAGTELTGKVEQAAISDNKLQLEFDTLSKLYFEADTSVKYAGKEKLYKRAAVRSMDWRKLAIAASLLLCVSTWLVLNQSEQEEVNDDRVAVNTPPVKQPVVAAPAVIDTINNTDTPVMQEPSSSEAHRENTEKQSKPSARPNYSTVEHTTVQEPVTSKTEGINNGSSAIVNNGNGVKSNQGQSSPEPVKEPVETTSRQAAVEAPASVVSVKEPEKEKKSLFKKIGKQISDRALDILSDGGDNINVAGFAIRVEK